MKLELYIYLFFLSCYKCLFISYHMVVLLFNFCNFAVVLYKLLCFYSSLLFILILFLKSLVFNLILVSLLFIVLPYFSTFSCELYFVRIFVPFNLISKSSSSNISTKDRGKNCLLLSFL